MKYRFKKLWRSWKWPLFLVGFALAFWFGFVPFAKYVFIGKTLEVYNEAADKYSTDGDNSLEYKGVITDTLIRPSAKVKGQQDTTIHRQSIQLAPQAQPLDGKPRREDVGVFGDSAGLLNAFFSFLAFAAVLLTLYKQSKKDGHDKQNGARVLFEQEFFAMVGMLEDIVSHLSIIVEEPVKTATLTEEAAQRIGYSPAQGGTPQVLETGKRKVEGREVFRYIYKDREGSSLINYVNGEEKWYKTEEAKQMCFDGTLDHYFRYLYRILKHIKENQLLAQLDDPDEEREKYAHLLRAQLSNYELLMWFYNSLLGEHPTTVKGLIEEYAMFNNLRVEELGRRDRVYYKPIADKERIEDPVGIRLNETYKVSAFWDEEDIKKIRNERQRKIREEKGFFWSLMNKLTMMLYHKFGTIEKPKRVRQPRRRTPVNDRAGGGIQEQQPRPVMPVERRIRLQEDRRGLRPLYPPRNMQEKKERDRKRKK